MEPAKSAEQSHRERQDLYKKLWAENPSLYVVWGIVIGLLIAAVIGGNESVWGVLVSFAPEFAGLLFVALVLDRRAAYRERERRKQQLIRDMRSGSHDFGLRAINELRHEGWLTDGTLQGATLSDANLKDAILMDANLKGAWLERANLQRTWMVDADLQGAHLLLAQFQDAELGGVNLQEALLNHHLSNVLDIDALPPQFNQKTHLPDGVYYDPQQGPEQLDRFINPEHPKFWRSDNPHSPAYRGHSEPPATNETE